MLSGIKNFKLFKMLTYDGSFAEIYFCLVTIGINISVFDNIDIKAGVYQTQGYLGQTCYINSL